MKCSDTRGNHHNHCTWCQDDISEITLELTSDHISSHPADRSHLHPALLSQLNWDQNKTNQKYGWSWCPHPHHEHRAVSPSVGPWGGGRRRKWLLIFVDIPAAGQKAAGVFHHNYPHRVWQSEAVRCDRCNVRPGTESFTTITMLSPLTLTGRGGGGAFIWKLEISPLSLNQKLRFRVISLSPSLISPPPPPPIQTLLIVIFLCWSLILGSGRCLIWQAMKQCMFNI